ncbi:MAG: hypothetical protein QM831_35600 [Kofleriaceae bacterium]
MRLVVLVVALLAGTAHAGFFCDEDPNPVELKALEVYAKSKTTTPDLGGAWICLGNTQKPKLTKRTLAACETVLDREPKNEMCNTIVAKLGQATLGKHDILAWVERQPLEPWNVNSSMPSYPFWLLQALADPRASAFIVDKWKTLIPIEAKHEKSSGWMSDWSGWRQHAAEALGAGANDADTITFLKEQAGLTKDTHVKDACLTAAAAIENRDVK